MLAQEPMPLGVYIVTCHASCSLCHTDRLISICIIVWWILTWESTLNIHWKDWCWSWNSNTLASWCEELTLEKNPDAGKDWRQEEKGATEDEMFGWHHWFNGHDFEQTLRGKGQGILACCSPWDGKDSGRPEQLNNINNQNGYKDTYWANTTGNWHQ